MVINNKKNQPVILVILDGWGVAPPNRGNAIELAKKPNFDRLVKEYPYTELCAHGHCVGLPKNQVGNSEAGHLNLGAGRIVKDDAVYISSAIRDGAFFKNPVFHEGVRHLKKHKSNIHLMGLVTEENSAHSSPEHWLAMLKFLDEEGIKKVYLHLFTDGRDSAQHAAIKIIERFEQKINHNHFNHHIEIKIASISGRYYAMNRTKDWPLIEKVYNTLVLGKAISAKNAKEAIIQAYNRQETDEFITPTVIKSDSQPTVTINDNDVVIFMNLRSDRARQLTKVFVQKEFNKKNPGSFKREKWPDNLFFIALTDFGPDLDSVHTAYPSRALKNTLPIVLKGLKQLYIAEREKYAHVTFFFNGGYDHAVAGEEQILIPSPEVKSYDQTPEMSTAKLYQKVVAKIQSNHPDFIVINFCNPDMLGHTGNLEATKKTIECVDDYLGKLIKIAQKENYYIIVTADHGNAEEMIDLKTNEVLTTHTTNPVPFILITDKQKQFKLRKGGILADVAPTILDLIGIEKPIEMTGISLILKNKDKK